MENDNGLWAKVPEKYRTALPYVHAVRALDSALREGSPLNVSVDELIVSGERERVAILVIPHHQLGGVALLVWSDMTGIVLSWGHVVTLRRHDDIDMSLRVDPAVPFGDHEAAAASLATELGRPIVVEPIFAGPRKGRLECSIEVDSHRRAIGGPRFTNLAIPDKTVTTSLASDPLAFTVPVPLDELQRFA
jgi:hypothetical protein